MTAQWKGAHPRNFSRGRSGHRPEAIVIHIMDGTLVGTDSWFNDPVSRVSAHYGVGKTGIVHQYVRETDSAFHAGTIVAPTWRLLKRDVNPNFYTLGIEHEGFGGRGAAWPEAMLEASLALVRDLASRWDIPIDADHIVPHRAIRANKPNCPGIDIADYVERLAAIAPPPRPAPVETAFARQVRIVRAVNVRRGPTTAGVALRTLLPGDAFTAVAKTVGEEVSGNDIWFRNAGQEYVWAANTDHPNG
ncbi:MAG TPA: N-acetylmuramoyl-L-alanine amidase [Allosphingosinicella sp.]|jgi:hypothetical protein